MSVLQGFCAETSVAQTIPVGRTWKKRKIHSLKVKMDFTDFDTPGIGGGTRTLLGTRQVPRWAVGSGAVARPDSGRVTGKGMEIIKRVDAGVNVSLAKISAVADVIMQAQMTPSFWASIAEARANRRPFALAIFALAIDEAHMAALAFSRAPPIQANP